MADGIEPPVSHCLVDEPASDANDRELFRQLDGGFQQDGRVLQMRLPSTFPQWPDPETSPPPPKSGDAPNVVVAKPGPRHPRVAS